MTAIIGIQTEKFSAMCSDRRVTRGTSINLTSEPKIFKNNGIYFGFSGYATTSQEILYNFTPPDKVEGKTENEYIFRLLETLKNFGENYDKCNVDKRFDNFECLFSYNGKLYETNNYYSKCELTNHSFASVGCSGELINGILLSETENSDVSKFSEDQCKELFKKCIRLASKYSSGVSEEYDVIFDYRNE